jgi:hypothetical protein
MVRFTIRDVLWLTVVVALATGWAINWYRLKATNETLRNESSELRRANFELGLELVAARSSPRGEQRIRQLHEAAKKSPLSPDEAREVLFEVMHAEDFRIRVRAMAILPHLREREEAIATLRLALRERDENGVIPTYAASYLAAMKATDAIDDLREWLAYLESEQPYDSDVRETLINNGKKRLAELSASIEAPSAITKERAIEIVRSLKLRPGDYAEFDCKEVAEGYRVAVQYYVLDEHGNRSSSPGSHALYVLDRSGNILKTIKGL